MEPSETVELPTNFDEAHIDNLAILIADMLERLIAHNDRIPLLAESLTRFHSRSTPSISILDYLRRIVQFTNVEKTCLLITLHYIDQICARMPLFTLSSLTCHRFVIASITVSSKGLCDVFCTNSLYARVGGISIAELNVLEREFLHAIDWHLTCTRETLQEYYVNLVRTHSTGQFVVAGTRSSENSSTPSSDTDSDLIIIDSAASRPTSPTIDPTPITAFRPRRYSVNEFADLTSTGTTTATTTPPPPPPPSTQVRSRRPTIEQNMAFAALQESLGRRMEE